MNDRASRIAVIADTVRARRLDLRLQQQDLADLAGTSVRFVHTLEAGKETIRVDKLLDVLDALGLDLVVTGGSAAP